MTDEDDEFVRIEKESLWRKRQIEEDLGQPVYFKPKKEWVDLTDEEIDKTIKTHWGEMKGGPLTFNRKYVQAIQAKLKEMNHD